MAYLTAAGPGLGFLADSMAAGQVLSPYDPYAADPHRGGAQYPPYLYQALASVAFSDVAALLSRLLNLTAPLLLVWSLRGPREAGFLLTLTPQSVAAIHDNSLQWAPVLGFAGLAWATRQRALPWAGVVAGAGIALALGKLDQLVLTPAVLGVRDRRTTLLAAAVTAALLAASFLVYGVWLSTWFDYLLLREWTRIGWDSLLVTLQRFGLPENGILLVQAAVLLDSLRYVWRWRAHADPRLSWVVTLAAANIVATHSGVIDSLPLLTVTVCLLPLRWSLVLAALGWTYVVSAALMTGQLVASFYGVVPVICVVLSVLAVRKTGVKL